MYLTPFYQPPPAFSYIYVTTVYEIHFDVCRNYYKDVRVCKGFIKRFGDATCRTLAMYAT